LNALARSGLEIGAARLEGAAPVALAPRVYQIGEARLRVEGFAEAPQRLRACAHRAEAEVCLDAHAQGGLLLKIWRP
ncbi:hypothetical protein KJ940_04115, partial [Myxococcota bacterium]|nr:hypothetical protein [Myxococcota bacterium]